MARHLHTASMVGAEGSLPPTKRREAHHTRSEAHHTRSETHHNAPPAQSVLIAHARRGSKTGLKSDDNKGAKAQRRKGRAHIVKFLSTLEGAVALIASHVACLLLILDFIS